MCSVCLGRGHREQQCTSKCGGRYTPPQANPKGGGKQGQWQQRSPQYGPGKGGLRDFHEAPNYQPEDEPWMAQGMEQMQQAPSMARTNQWGGAWQGYGVQQGPQQTQKVGSVMQPRTLKLSAVTTSASQDVVAKDSCNSDSDGYVMPREFAKFQTPRPPRTFAGENKFGMLDDILVVRVVREVVQWDCDRGCAHWGLQLLRLPPSNHPGHPP